MNKPIILNGKRVAEELYSKLPNMNGKKLVIISIGSNDASKIYVRNKLLACDRVGLEGENITFYPEDYKSEEQLKKFIEDTIYSLNLDDNIVGIMIQKPYSKNLEKYHFEELIYPRKDVDGLCYYNMVSTLLGRKPFHYPATPKGIITLLDYYNIPIEGKNVVIIGRSDIVGKPLAAMLIARDATVSIAHSKTKELWNITCHADIIISAIGKPKYINKSFLDYEDILGNKIYKYPVIIDVGINRDENGKLCGDVDFDDVLPYVSAITPVPGGVGPMTVYSLIKNCCKNV